MTKIIINKVSNCPTIPWETIKTWEFNQLKDNSNRDISRLKNSILRNGFIAPFDCWKGGNKPFVLDGSGRYLALLQLETEGIEIPALPVLFIDANNLKQAKLYALQRSGTNGQITQASLADFTSTEFEIEELKELAMQELSLSSLDYMILNLDNEITPTEKEINLPDNERGFLSQSFSLSLRQDSLVKSAISLAKSNPEVDDIKDNENSNGNSLEVICNFYLKSNF